VPHRLLAAVAAVVCGVTSLRAAEAPAVLFKKDWEGRRVVAQRTLYTIVFDERGRIGGTQRGKRDGLTVIAPAKGLYYRFSGRQSQDDVIHADPDKVLDLVTATYRRDRTLNEGFTQTITPQHLVQYPRGIELTVRRVDVLRAEVVLVLHKIDPASEFATTVAVQWPSNLSSDFSERPEIERALSLLVRAP
jgi:hypothetical protein